MLTIPVNIAVFAVFRRCVEACSALIPDFKRVCGACHAHEGGKSGKIGGKSGKIAARMWQGGWQRRQGRQHGRQTSLPLPHEGRSRPAGRENENYHRGTEETEVTRRDEEEFVFL
jgi:hypothetical protein